MHPTCYKPQWEHLERHPGSYAGGVSSIDFSAPPTQASPSGGHTKGRGEFAAKNEASSLFKTEDLSAASKKPANDQRQQNARAVPPGGHSSVSFGSDQKGAGQRPTSSDAMEQTPPSRTSRNPVLGVDCQSFDSLSSGYHAAGYNAAISGRQDRNRSSVQGGIFGHLDAAGHGDTGMQAPARRDPNEMSRSTRVGSKRVVDGFVEYCA
mmetsp:Transcript_43897/g.80218  ORF Transcript_43897/g.80218 Transcript_43897/m.80218 type:complete len:208 (+) Transcript_43897:100-723(+)